MFTQRVALFNQSGIANYSDLLIQYQSCIRSARPKQKLHTKFIYDELANRNVSNLEVLILFQASLSCFKIGGSGAQYYFCFNLFLNKKIINKRIISGIPISCSIII